MDNVDDAPPPEDAMFLLFLRIELFVLQWQENVVVWFLFVIRDDGWYSTSIVYTLECIKSVSY